MHNGNRNLPYGFNEGAYECLIGVGFVVFACAYAGIAAAVFAGGV